MGIPSIASASTDERPMPGFRRNIEIVLMSLVLLPGIARAQSVAFQHPLDNSPLEIKPLPNEKETDAVKEFQATGQNRHRDMPEALAEGKELYAQHCQSCHLPDGSGRLGPSLTTNDWKYKRCTTDVGMFEVIYAGAAGAMQSFFRRGVTQDEMLKIIAYVRTLKK
jgi:cytochrome c-L